MATVIFGDAGGSSEGVETCIITGAFAAGTGSTAEPPVGLVEASTAVGSAEVGVEPFGVTTGVTGGAASSDDGTATDADGDGDGVGEGLADALVLGVEPLAEPVGLLLEPVETPPEPVVVCALITTCGDSPPPTVVVVEPWVVVVVVVEVSPDEVPADAPDSEPELPVLVCAVTDDDGEVEAEDPASALPEPPLEPVSEPAPLEVPEPPPVLDELESPSVAHAIPGEDAAANPIPRAAASAPIRPM